MKTTLVILLFLALPMITPFAAEARNLAQVRVKGIVCSFCAEGIRKLLMKEEGVDSVSIALRTGTVSIQFKSEKSLSDEQIKKLIEDAGYDVSKIDRN